MSGVHITDHAVIRYLERGWGVNVDAIRARIASNAGRPVML
ncbi:hypothetical protein [Ruegeria sp.]